MPQKSSSEALRQHFMTLYEPVHERLVRYCHAHAYGDFTPGDLVNETVLRAWENFDRLREDGAFLHFLFGIARNIMRNHARRRKFRGEYKEENVHQLMITEATGDIQTDVNLLYRAMDQLPESQKEAILLFEVSGFSIKEIMDIQDSGMSAVKARLMRGRKRLTELLAEPVEWTTHQKISAS